MKSFLATVAAAALVASANAATCSVTTLAPLLGDAHIDQCGTDSGYSFTSGVKPTTAQVNAMCGSTACHELLADALALNLSECQVPLGDHINLLADLINYASGICNAASPSPTTAAPSTPSATTATPSTTTATPSSTTAAPAAC